MSKIVYDMPFDEYTAVDALNASTLKAFHVSAKQGAHNAEAKRETTASMRLGRALHDRMELGASFDGVAMEVKGLKPGAVAKTWAKHEAEKENPSHILLAEGWRLQIEKMHDAIMAHPKAGPVCRLASQREVSVFWDDPDLGVPCKARFDRLIPGVGVVDVKTAASVEPHKIGYAICDYGYHIQDPFYRRGAHIACGIPNPDFVFVFVSNTAPFDVVPGCLDDESIEQGWADICVAADRWKHWRKTGEAPGITQGVMTLSLPRRAITEGQRAPYSLLKGDQ